MIDQTNQPTKQTNKPKTHLKQHNTYNGTAFDENGNKAKRGHDPSAANKGFVLAVVAVVGVVDHPQNNNSKKKTILLCLNRNANNDDDDERTEWNECGACLCCCRLRIRTRNDPGHGSDGCDFCCRVDKIILGSVCVTVFFIVLVVVVAPFVDNPMATERSGGDGWDWNEVVGNCRFRILVIVVVHKAEGYILWLYGLLFVFIFVQPYTSVQAFPVFYQISFQ
jgi:hypothetical protein